MVELREFDAADYLDSDEMIVAFLVDVAQDDNPDVFLNALSAVARARARGIADISKETGSERAKTARKKDSGEEI